MTTLDESAQAEDSTRARPSLRTAGWYDDPQQLHDQRFYDGHVWTKHVTHFGPKPCSGCSN